MVVIPSLLFFRFVYFDAYPTRLRSHVRPHHVDPPLVSHRTEIEISPVQLVLSLVDPNAVFVVRRVREVAEHKVAWPDGIF